MAIALVHADDGGIDRRAADPVAATRAHVEHLCAILSCAVLGALLGAIVLAELLAGGRGNGLLAGILALASVAFLLGVPYCACRWWHFATTGRDDWMVD